MSVHEFETPIPVDTPLGKGLAIFVEPDNHDAYWTVALIETRALVTFRQQQLRIGRSYTYGSINDDTMKRIIT